MTKKKDETTPKKGNGLKKKEPKEKITSPDELTDEEIAELNNVDIAPYSSLFGYD